MSKDLELRSFLLLAIASQITKQSKCYQVCSCGQAMHHTRLVDGADDVRSRWTLRLISSEPSHAPSTDKQIEMLNNLLAELTSIVCRELIRPSLSFCLSRKCAEQCRCLLTDMKASLDCKACLQYIGHLDMHHKVILLAAKVHSLLARSSVLFQTQAAAAWVHLIPVWGPSALLSSKIFSNKTVCIALIAKFGLTIDHKIVLCCLIA